MTKRSVAGTAVDPTIQFSTLVIGEKAYKLAYSFNAIAEAEAVAGCNLLSGLLILHDLTALQLRGLLYAALTVAQPETTLDEAGKLITIDAMYAITEALAQAYSLSMPSKKKVKPELETPAAI